MRLTVVRSCHVVASAALVAVLSAGCLGVTTQMQPPPVLPAPTAAAQAGTAAEPDPAIPFSVATSAPSGPPAETAAAVSMAPATAAPPATSTRAPTAAPSATATPAPTLTTTPQRALRLGVAAGAPPAALSPVLAALSATGASAEQASDEPDLQLAPAGQEAPFAAWEQVFTPVTRMSSLLDGVSVDELKAVWTGSGKSPNFATIYVTNDAVDLLTSLLGTPGGNVTSVASEELEGAVWGDATGLGIVPFDALTVKLRAVRVDGQSPVDNRFEPQAWPLTARASLLALTPPGHEALARAAAGLPVTNRDPSKLTVLVMTGVTAMARNSAVAIEKSGDYGFLARVVGPELAAADITTISNEIPFVPGCVANGSPNNLVLCSKPEYWENLALSGVDAVGLTGNHLLDFGRKAATGSLALYEEKEVPIYGGGANEKEAAEPLVIEHHGNRLGFLGANQYGPPVAWAGPDKPGSARFTLPAMQTAIQDLKRQADLVFAEVQHLETNYKGEYVNVPNDQAEIDFRGLNDAGADVVTGVMAHAPQALEFRDGRLILYGLGNLYFDQTWSWPTRTGLVPRHTIYDGKLVNTELLVTVIDKNFQLRWATPQERQQVLKSLFDVSRW